MVFFASMVMTGMVFPWHWFTRIFSGDRINDLTDQCSPILVEALQVNLVGGIPTPLKNDGVKVSWGYCSQYMEN
jgi:hypothetical protein